LSDLEQAILFVLLFPGSLLLIIFFFRIWAYFDDRQAEWASKQGKSEIKEEKAEPVHST
jgi:hypothetical protein